jgi:hypothetical protein
MRRSAKILAVISVTILLPRQSAAQDSLTAARDLYSAAAYEDALSVLDRLVAANVAPPDRFSINQYRAFCLLALGRTSDAERAIEAVVSDRPLYHPSDGEASPRLRSVFTTVRQRMLPVIVQQKYAQAKAAFDQKDFANAEQGFGQVLDALADPDLAIAAAKPPLADIGTLSAGFRELAARAAKPPVVAEAAPPQPVRDTLPPAILPQRPPAVPPQRRVFNLGETDVTPPVILRQELPPFPRDVGSMSQGVLEIIIDETGAVESAVIKSPMNPRYDQLLIGATRNWRYKPATMGGTPIKFRKVINISMKTGD